MSLFNLWSSERLSLSLSVVAVISAAVTSYYQWFYHESTVSVKIIPDFGLAEDTVFMRAILMNEGTHSVAVSFAQVFVTGDSARSQQRKVSGGPNSDYNLTRLDRENTIASNFRDCMIVPDKSVVQLKIPIPLGRNERTSLIEKTKQILERDSLVSADFFLGMAFELTDPYGAVSFLSTTAVEGTISSNPDRKWQSTGEEYGRVFNMPQFRKSN